MPRDVLIKIVLLYNLHNIFVKTLFNLYVIKIQPVLTAQAHYVWSASHSKKYNDAILYLVYKIYCVIAIDTFKTPLKCMKAIIQ
jgi:hypothetical protein